MATSSGVYVGSAVLEDLQSKLMKLSGSLKDVYETMVGQMERLDEFWQDSKYEEFKQGFSPHIKQCMDISGYYASWSKDTLGKVIASVQEVERTDVSGGTIGGVGAASAGAMVGAGATGAAAVGSTIGSGFNVGGQPTQGKIHYNHYSKLGNAFGMPSDAEQKCIDAHGRSWSPVSDNVAKKYSGSYEVKDTPQEKEIHGGKFESTVEGKLEASVPLGVVTANAQGGVSSTIGMENKSEKNWKPIFCMNQDDIDEINERNGYKKK